jgi:hypothetical protein
MSTDVADRTLALEERTGVRCALATNKTERTCRQLY